MKSKRIQTSGAVAPDGLMRGMTPTKFPMNWQSPLGAKLMLCHQTRLQYNAALNKQYYYRQFP
jgi:hypothetical protein